jgi:hypothetical protein
MCQTRNGLDTRRRRCRIRAGESAGRGSGRGPTGHEPPEMAPWPRSQSVRGLAAGAGTARDVQRRLVRVAGDGVDVGTAGEQVVGGSALTAVAGLPESVVELVLGGLRVTFDQFYDATLLAECGRLPQLLDARTTGDQQARHVPAAVANRRRWRRRAPPGRRHRR